MVLKTDSKFEEKLICAFKTDMRNLGNFLQSIWKSRNWDFDRILLSKVRKYMMQNWIRNWHFRIDMRTLLEFLPKHSKISKICTLMGCLWPKYVMFELRKEQRSYVWWHWIMMQSLKENWFVLSKMTWGIWEISNRAIESLEIGTSMGFFYPNLENVWA